MTPKLVLRAYDDAWNPETDLPWTSPANWERSEVPDTVSLVARLPAYARMPKKKRADAKRREMASHLSSLAFGERRAATLSAETALLARDEDPDATWFLGTLMADEAKHHATLRRYLKEKLQVEYEAPLPLQSVFAHLSELGDYDLNLLVGQIVLEGSAAALLNSLLLGMKEPLLRALLQHIARDEARHMKFAEQATRTIGKGFSAKRQRLMEDVLFEAALAGAASLIPSVVWAEMGLDLKVSRRFAVDALKERGVIRFYTHVVVHPLRKRGFPTARLEALLGGSLEAQLR